MERNETYHNETWRNVTWQNVTKCNKMKTGTCKLKFNIKCLVNCVESKQYAVMNMYNCYVLKYTSTNFAYIDCRGSRWLQKVSFICFAIDPVLEWCELVSAHLNWTLIVIAPSTAVVDVLYYV